MKIKNLIPLFLVVLFLNISCKKEILKDESSILIGKWRKTKTINRTSYGGICSVNITTFDVNTSALLEIKKTGEMTLYDCGSEQEFSMSFDNIDEDFNQRIEYIEFGCSHSVVDSIKNGFRIVPDIYVKKEKKTYYSVIHLNSKKLIIKSYSQLDLFSINGDSRQLYYYVFEKVN